MQDHITYLVIEDINKWTQGINNALKHYFVHRVGMAEERIRAFSAYDGDQANQLLSAGTFDLLTLDMNLSGGTSGSKISGRDLLLQLPDLSGEIGAYFIIIITGAIHEGAQLEVLYGRDAAARMRYGAYNEAVQRIPAERVRIIHKPNTRDVEAGIKEMIPHLYSALDQYCNVSRERNIFRPLSGCKTKGKKRYWEFRYNGGPRRDIAETPGFEMCRSALATPNLEMRIIALMKALARSSGVMPTVTNPVDSADPRIKAESEELIQEGQHISLIVGGEDARSEGALGFDFDDLAGLSILPDSPVDANIGGTVVPVETLILGLLDVRRSGGDLMELLQKCVRDMDLPIGSLRAIPARIAYYLDRKHHIQAKNEFGGDDTIGRLADLLNELKPVINRIASCDPASSRSAQPDQPKAKPHKVRLSISDDPKETKNARQHWKRVLRELRLHEQRALASHIEKHMKRGNRAPGRLTYHFDPKDGFPPFWLTH